MEILFELEDLSYVSVIFNVVLLVSAKKIAKLTQVVRFKQTTDNTGYLKNGYTL